MTFIKFILIIVLVYAVYYGINILFDLVKPKNDTIKSQTKQTIDVIKNPVSNDVEKKEDEDIFLQRAVVSKRISLTDLEDEYKKYATAPSSKNKSDSSIIADLGIEEVNVNAGISVFELDNQNLDNYVID